MQPRHAEGNMTADGVHTYAYDASGRSSSPGEFHPEALTEPYVTLSRHTALHSDSLSLARNRRLWKERLLLVAQLAHGFRRAMSPSSLHVHYRRFITTTG